MGFPKRIFCNSWVVGFLEARPWQARRRIGKTISAAGSSRSWIAWATRRGGECVRLCVQRSWDGVLKPVVARYQGKVSRIYFRADAAFAMPEVYEFLEAERIKYAIRLPANQVLQSRIGYLLKRPVGRPPNEVRRFYANFTYQAGSWTKPRRVIAKVEWHPGELYPRVGFIVTNLSRLAERVVAFYR